MKVESYTSGQPPWLVSCSVCKFKKAYREEYKARNAAAQHLNYNRATHHELAKRPKDVGNVRICPTPKKKRHKNQQEAKEHIATLYSNGLGNQDYRAYACKCGAWHVGHSQVHLAIRARKALRK